jgi:hypothetical protein
MKKHLLFIFMLLEKEAIEQGWKRSKGQNEVFFFYKKIFFLKHL